MTFHVIDTQTGEKPTQYLIRQIAEISGLTEIGEHKFFVGEDGQLIMTDYHGNMVFFDDDRLKVVVESEGEE